MEAGASSGPDLAPDLLAPSPSDPTPHTVSMYGILGESAIASHARLYLDRGLTTYYDIPVDGIVERDRTAAEMSPLGVDSTRLTVRADIRLVVHRVATRSVEAEFLAGDFTAPGSFVPAPPVGLGARAAWIVDTGKSNCFSFHPQCGCWAPAAHESQRESTAGMCHAAADRPPTQTYCTGVMCH